MLSRARARTVRRNSFQQVDFSDNSSPTEDEIQDEIIFITCNRKRQQTGTLNATNLPPLEQNLIRFPPVLTSKNALFTHIIGS